MSIRRSARVVLVNDRDEVFMLRHTGEKRTYWVLPGGGLEPGESWEEAALREMWEEAGIRNVPLGPCLWTRSGENHAGGSPWISEERYFLVRCGDRQASTANQLPNERAYYTMTRWWSLEQIRSSSEIIYPTGLADLLQPVFEGRTIPFPVRLPE